MSSQTNRWCSPSREREIALDDDIVPINDYLNGPDWWYDGLREIQNFFPDPDSSQHVDDRNDTTESAPTRIDGETAGPLEPSNLHNAFATPNLEVPRTMVSLPRQTEERMRDVQFQLPKDPQHAYLNESMVSSPPPYQEVDRLANKDVGHNFSHEPSLLPGTTSSQSNHQENQSFSHAEDAMPIDSGNLAPSSTPFTNYNDVREVGDQNYHHQSSLQGFNSATSTGDTYDALVLDENASSHTSFTGHQTSPGNGQTESHSLPSRSRVHSNYDNGFGLPPFPYVDKAPASDFEDGGDQDQPVPKQSATELDPRQGVSEQITSPKISSHVTTGAPSPKFITKDDIVNTHRPNSNDVVSTSHVSSTILDLLTDSSDTVLDNRHVFDTGLTFDLPKNGETSHTSRPVIFKPYAKGSLGKDLSASTLAKDTVVPSIDEGENTLHAGSAISLGSKRIGATFANREQSPMKKLKLAEESKPAQVRIDSNIPISASSEMRQENEEVIEDKMDIDALTEPFMPTVHDVKPEKTADLHKDQVPDPVLQRVPSIPIPIRPDVEVRISPSRDSVPLRSSTAPTSQDKTTRTPSGSSITEKPLPLVAKPRSIHMENAEIMPPPLITTSKTNQQPEAETTQSKSWRAVSGRALPSLASMEAPAFSPLTPVFPPGSLSIAPIPNDSASDSLTGQPPQSIAALSEDISNVSPAIATPIERPKRRQISLRELTSLAPDGGYVQSDTPARRSATTATGVPTLTSSRRTMTPITVTASQRSATSSTAVPGVAANVASSRRSSSSSLSTIPTPVLESLRLPDKGKARTGPSHSPGKGYSSKQTEAEDGPNQGGMNPEEGELNSMRSLNLPRAGDTITSTPGYGLAVPPSSTRAPRKTAISRASAADEQDQVSPQQKGALTKQRNAEAKAKAAAEVEGLSAQQKGALTKKRNADAAAAAAAEEEGLSAQRKGALTKKRNALAAAPETPVTPTKSKSKTRPAALKANLDSNTDSPSYMTTNSRPKRTTSGSRSAYSAPEEADEDSENESQSSFKRPVRKRGVPRNMLKELGIPPSQLSDSPVQTRRSSATTFESGGDWASGLRRNLGRRTANWRAISATNQDDEVDKADELASTNTWSTTGGNSGSGKDKEKKRDARR